MGNESFKQTRRESVFVAKGFVKNSIGNKYNRLSEIENIKKWFAPNTVKKVVDWCNMYIEGKIDKPFIILAGNGSAGRTTLVAHIIRNILETRYYNEVSSSVRKNPYRQINFEMPIYISLGEMLIDITRREKFDEYKNVKELIIEDFDGGGYEGNLIALYSMLNKRARHDNFVLFTTRVNKKIRDWMCGENMDIKSDKQQRWTEIWDLLNRESYIIKVEKQQ